MLNTVTHVCQISLVFIFNHNLKSALYIVFTYYIICQCGVAWVISMLVKFKKQCVGIGSVFHFASRGN